MPSLLHCPKEIVRTTRAVALTLTGESRTVQTYNPKICHSERNGVKSRDLRIFNMYKVKLVRRSFDSLRSLRMTAGVVRWIESAYL